MRSSRSRFSVLLSALVVGTAPLVAGCGGGGGGTASAVPSGPTGTTVAPYASGAKVDSDATQAANQDTEVTTFAALPTKVDLSAAMPPVGDQGSENSCVAWAIGYAIKGYLAHQDVWNAISPQTASAGYTFSPAYVYNQINGGVDEGSYPSDAMNLLKSQGVATMADMPYVSGQFLTQPSAAAKADAAKYKIRSWGTLKAGKTSGGADWATPIRTALAKNTPVALLIPIYPALHALNAANPVLSSDAGTPNGSHEVVVVGYDDAAQRFKLQNSWGTGWGAAGYFYATYAIVNKDALEAVVAHDGTATSGAAPTPAPTASPKPSKP